MTRRQLPFKYRKGGFSMKNLSLSKKLVVGFGIVFLVLLTAIITSIISINN